MSHQHHYKIATPTPGRSTVAGTCIGCKKRRTFAAYLPEGARITTSQLGLGGNYNWTKEREGRERRMGVRA